MLGVWSIVKNWYLPVLNSYPEASAFWCVHVRIAPSISRNREVKFCPRVVNQIKSQLNDSQLAVGQVPVWLPPKDYKSQHAARWASTAPPLPRWPARGRRSRHRLLSMLLSWARNGNRLLVAWRRVRGLGVRGEAGEAAWTACVLPRQALRAAGEKAGPLGLIPAPGPRAPGSRPDSASDAPRPRGLPPNPNPPGTSPASTRTPWCPFPYSSRSLLGPALSAPEGIPAPSAINSHLASGLPPGGSLASRPCSKICSCSRGTSLLLLPGSQGPQKSSPRPLFRPQCCLLPEPWRPTHGPALVHWVPPAHVNPVQMVTIVQL